MPMIVREMILLDAQLFDSFRKPGDFSDDSGWLGPPRAVPFAWELAPGTPKRESPASTPTVLSPSREAAYKEALASVPEQPLEQVAAPLELAIVKVDSLREDFGSSRNSMHFLDKAPPSLLAAPFSEVSGELWNSLMPSFRKGSVPFKWEMEPGIPRDPDKCREFLNCPLTPPPVLHSRSMIVRKTKDGSSSVSEKLRNLFSNGEHSPKKIKQLWAPNTRSASRRETNHSEDEELSPISVLDYSNSVRFNAGSAPRLSSASSSTTSYYHTPKDSFSWDSNQDFNSSTRSSIKSVGKSGREILVKKSSSSLSSLFMQLHQKKKRHQPQQQQDASSNGCLMMLTGTGAGNRSGSFNTYEESTSEFNSSEKSSSICGTSSSSSLSSEQQHRDENGKQHEAEAEEEEGEEDDEIYYSPLPSTIQSPAQFGLHSIKQQQEQQQHQVKNCLQLVERIDSLESVDPGFAPSESGDENRASGDRVFRLASFAHWQRRQASPKQRGNIARSLLGVVVCCYAPRNLR